LIIEAGRDDVVNLHLSVPPRHQTRR
jgi:hypothetical protein